jgi:uridine kinase
MTSPGLPLTIGIGGPSGAGKSQLAGELARVFSPAAVLSLDWFFRIPDDGIYANYWDIRCYDAEGFAQALVALRAGQVGNAPMIDFRDFTRTGWQAVVPAALIIVEGMALYRVPGVLSQIDLSFFLDPPEAIVRARKQNRDHRQRDRQPESIDQQWRWVVTEWQRDLKQLLPFVHIVREADPLAIVCSLISARHQVRDTR